MSPLYPKVKYSMFIGSWQSWHAENTWMVENRIKDGKHVLICVLDTDQNEKTPLSANEIESNIKKHLWKYIGDGKVKVIQIPDIESINFGSHTEYDIIFHKEKMDKEKMARQIRSELEEESSL